MRRGVIRHNSLPAVLGIAAVALSGCATARTEAVRTEARCYPHIYLDNRYAIHGTYAGEPQTAEDGDCYRFLYYQDGRVARVDYQRRGTPTPDPSFGVASFRVEYSGNSEKRSFLGTDGRPAPNAGGLYAIQLKHDGSGNPVEWRNLGAGGELLEDKTSGLAIMRWRYDGQGRIVEESHLGANEQLKADARRGVAIVRWRYDRQGNTLEESYFGPDGRPTGDRLRGVAAVRWGYGTHGKTVEESYFGTDGQRTDDKNRGVATVRWQYDADWNTVEERYLGADQRSKADRRLGVATIRWQYDRYGREIGTTMFDQNGAPVRGARD
jgi:YD repeat-containing protein